MNIAVKNSSVPDGDNEQTIKNFLVDRKLINQGDPFPKQLKTTLSMIKLSELVGYKLIPSGRLDSIGEVIDFQFSSVSLELDSEKKVFSLEIDSSDYKWSPSLLESIGIKLERLGFIYEWRYQAGLMYLDMLCDTRIGQTKVDAALRAPLQAFILQGQWSLSLTAPMSLTSAFKDILSLLGGTDMSRKFLGSAPIESFFPKGLDKLGFSLEKLEIQFNLRQMKIVSLSFLVSSTDLWEVNSDIPIVIGNVGLEMYMNFIAGCGILAKIHGVVEIGKENFVEAALSVNSTSCDCSLVMDGQFTIPGLTAVSSMPGKLDPGEFKLPDEIAKAVNISVPYFGIDFNPKKGTVSSIELAACSNVEFAIIPGLLKAGVPNFHIIVANPFNQKSVGQDRLITGEISCIVTIADIPLLASAVKDEFGWTFAISKSSQCQSIDLNTLVKKLSNNLISLPCKMDITTLSMLANTYQKSYSFDIEITGDWGLELGFLKAELRSVILSLSCNQAVFAGSIIAEAKLFGINFLFEAEKPPNANWIFYGCLDKGSEIDLIKLANSFFVKVGGFSLPDFINNTPFPIIKEMSVCIDTEKCINTFDIGINWSLALDKLLFDIKASLHLESFQIKPGTYGYSGYIEGDFKFYGLELIARYEFEKTSHSLDLKYKSLDCIYDMDSKVLTIKFLNQTLGSVLEFLISLASPGGKAGFSTPWNVLYSIPLGDIDLCVDFQNKVFRAGFDYADNPLDLSFIKLEYIGLVYKKQYGKSKIDLELRGDFLGEKYGDKNPLKWDVLNESPPSISGTGAAIFDLRYLGVGQHVSVVMTPREREKLNSVTKVLEKMKTALVPTGDTTKNPIEQLKGSLAFDSSSNWLLGADMTIMNTVTLGVIFNDPQIYGLLVKLSGQKAGNFNGLSFEILYRKITDTIGLYHIELTLPDIMRHLEFGAVSVTLPIVDIDIYTNGNFRVDFGFPASVKDFSRSFCVEVFPFLGYGGFYFAMLNGDTSRRVPQITNGNFSPVLEFGLALSVGLGKTISMGILSGGITVTVIGILQGCLGWFNPNNTSRSSDTFFWVQGTLGVAGKVYATVDFGIIKASVNLDVYATITATYESYKPMYIALFAGVEVSVSIKVLFVKIHFSFKATIHESFTIGSVGNPPWIVAPAADFFESLYTRRHANGILHARRITESCLRKPAPPLNLEAAAVGDKQTVNLLFMTGISRASDSDLLIPPQSPSGRVSCGALLFVENSVRTDAETSDQVINTIAGAEPSPFDMLISRVLRWVIAGIEKETEKVTLDELKDLYRQLNDEKVVGKYFNYQNLAAFMNLNFTFRILPYMLPKAIPCESFENLVLGRITVAGDKKFILTVFQKDSTGKSYLLSKDLKDVDIDRIYSIFNKYENYRDISFDDISAAFFPMIPDLVMSPFGQQDVNFKTNKIYSSDYEKKVDIYFKKLMSDYQNGVEDGQQPENDGDGLDEGLLLDILEESLAVYIFKSYFLMLARSSVQAAIDFMKQGQQDISDPENDSIRSVADSLGASRAVYTARRDDTVNSIASHFGLDSEEIRDMNPSIDTEEVEPQKHVLIPVKVTPESLVLANYDRRGILHSANAGGDPVQLPLNGIKYRVRAGDTLLGICNKFGGLQPLNVIELNFETKCLIASNITLNIESKNFMTGQRETFRSLADRIGLSPEALAREACVLGEAVLQPLGLLELPEVVHTVKEDDTFASIARRYDMDIDALTRNIKDVRGIFRRHREHLVEKQDTVSAIAAAYNLHENKLMEMNPCLEADGLKPGVSLKIEPLKINVSNVPIIEIDELVNKLADNGSFNNSAVMLSRFLLHGLRLPDPKDQSFRKIPINAMENLSCLAPIQTYPIYSLVGQETVAPDPDKGNIEIAIRNSGSTGQDRIKAVFAGGGTELRRKLTSGEIKLIHDYSSASLKAEDVQISPLLLCKYMPDSYITSQEEDWNCVQLPDFLEELQAALAPHPTIWFLPDSFTGRIAGSSKKVPDYLMMRQTKASGGPPVSPEEISQYYWATSINLKVMQITVDGKEIVPMPNTYLLAGADVQGMQSLLDCWTFLKQPDTNYTADIQLLYAPNPMDNNTTGLVSDKLDLNKTFIFKTNTSTESSSGANTVGNFDVLEDSGASQKTYGDYYSCLADNEARTQFLRLLWECSVVKSGGYYLNYVNSDESKGLPAHIFQQGSAGALTLLVTITSNASQVKNKNTLLPFANCVVTGESIDIKAVDVFAQAVTVEVTSGSTLGSLAQKLNIDAAVLISANSRMVGILRPGSLISINGGTYTIKFLDTFAGIAKSCSMTLQDIAAMNKDNTDLLAEGVYLQAYDGGVNKKPAVAAGNNGFEVYRPNPELMDDTPDVALARVYNLLGYKIKDNDFFTQSVEGMPVGPVRKKQNGSEGENKEKYWSFRQVIPVYRFGRYNTAAFSAALPLPSGNPYRGITDKSQVELKMHFNDVYGNRAPVVSGTGIVELGLTLDAGYTDDITSLTMWPGIKAGYDFAMAVKNPRLNFYCSFDPSKYLPGFGTLETCRELAKTHREAYRGVYFQVGQDDFGAALSVMMGNTVNAMPQDFNDALRMELYSLAASAYIFLSSALWLIPYSCAAASDSETLDSMSSRFNTDAGSLGRENKALKIGDLFDAQKILLPRYYLFKQGDSLDKLLAADSCKGVRSEDLASENKTVPLNSATVIKVKERSFVGEAVNKYSIYDITEAMSCSITDVRYLDPQIQNLPVGFATANADAPLTVGLDLTAGGVTCAVDVRRNTLRQMVDVFKTAPGIMDADEINVEYIAVANKYVKNIFAGVSGLKIPNYVIKDGDTLQDLAAVLDPYTPVPEGGNDPAGDIDKKVAMFLKDNSSIIDFFKAGSVLNVKSEEYPVTSADTLDSVATANNLTVEQLSMNNRGIKLKKNISLTIPGIVENKLPGYNVYRVQDAGDSLESIVKSFKGFTIEALVNLNHGVAGLFGTSINITVGERSITPETTDSLDTLAAKFNINALELARYISDSSGVLAKGAAITVMTCFSTYRTKVGDSFNGINGKYGSWTIDNMADLNGDIKGIFVPGKTIRHGDKNHQLKITDTINSVSSELGYTSPSTFINAIKDDTTIIRAGGMMITPLITVPVDMSTLQSTADNYNLDIGAMALANSTSYGLLRAGQSIRYEGTGGIFTRENETFISLVARINGSLKKDAPRATVTKVAAANPKLLLKPGAILLTPVYDASVSRESQITYSGDIFPVRAVLTLSRSGRINQVMEGDAAVKSLDVQLAPNIDFENPDGEAGSLKAFAIGFENSFHLLKAATGAKKRDDAAAGERQIWAVNFDQNTGGIGIQMQKDNPLFYALKPLSTKQWSRKGAIIKTYSNGMVSDKAVDFHNVDLNLWARDFMEAIDLFLSPRYTVAAFNSDRDSYESLVGFKESLAGSVSADVDYIISNDRITSESTSKAREALRQQMMIELSRAFKTDVLVQYPVKIASSIPVGKFAPMLSGKLIGDLKDTKLDYSFTTGKFALGNTGDGCTYATVLFNTMEEQENKLISFKNMAYVINEVEYDMHDAVDGEYLQSSWLSFIIPFTKNQVLKELISLGDLEIPVPLRNYPDIPVLSAQNAGLNCNPDDPAINVGQIKKWDYSFDMEQHSAAQDTVYLEIDFNMDAGENQAVSIGNQSPGDEKLFLALAQFIYSYPELKNGMQALLDGKGDGFVGQFVWFVKQVSDAWANRYSQNILRIETPTPDILKYKYEMEKTDQKTYMLKITDIPIRLIFTADSKYLGDLNKGVLPDGLKADLAANGAIPKSASVTLIKGIGRYWIVDLGGKPEDGIYCYIDRTDNKDGSVTLNVYPCVFPGIKDLNMAKSLDRQLQKDYMAYHGGNQPLSNLEYGFTGNDLFNRQSALACCYVKRNENLVEDGRVINGKFIYQTQSVSFLNKITPLIRIDRFYSIKKLLEMPEDSKLDACLTALFQKLLEGDASKARYIKVSCDIGFKLVSAIQPVDEANDSRDEDIFTYIPALFQPRANITDQKDFGSRLAEKARGKAQDIGLDPDGCRYHFDISVYSTLDNSTDMPILELRNLYFEL